MYEAFSISGEEVISIRQAALAQKIELLEQRTPAPALKAVVRGGGGSGGPFPARE